MTLRLKLLLAQLPLAASLIVVGLVARHTVRELDHNAQDILKDNHQSVLAMQRMRDATDEMARATLAETFRREPLPSPEARRLRDEFERALRFQEGNITESGERELTARLRVEWNELQRELDAGTSPATSDAETFYFSRFEPALRRLRSSAMEIVTLNQEAMVRKSDRARRTAERMSSLTLAVTLSAILLGFWGSIFFTNRLTRPLSVLAQAVRRFGQGDLFVRARLQGRDEIAQVAEEFNTMADRLAAYRSSSLGELLRAQQATQAAIDSLNDPVLVLDIGGGIQNANQATASLFGIDPDAVKSLEKAPLEARDVIERLRQHAMQGKGTYVPRGLEEAVAIPTRDGMHYFLPRASLVESGEGTALTIVLQDVTRLRRFDELKTDLVATVAHEFRTPLTSLRMAVHLCAEGAAGPLTPKQADLLYAAREDTERLQLLVDDLLDLSRIQAGRLELHRRPLSSASLLAEAIDEHSSSAKERAVELQLGAPTVDQFVLADPDRIRIVLSNLIGNALRHTPSGGRVELRAAPDQGMVRFEVSDTGPGIPPEYHPRLFDRFFRVPGTAGSGVGLGLFIAKEIVEAHGGAIGVESDPGAGAIFWFTLPTTAVAPA